MQESLFSALRRVLVLVISLAQLLIPLLHGHLGPPVQSGLHVHAAISNVVESVQRPVGDAPAADAFEHHASRLFLPSLSSAEPYEIDVEPATEPDDPQKMWATPAELTLQSWVLLWLVTIVAAAAVIRPRAYTSPHFRWRRRAHGLPPAQAPPLFA